MMYPHKLRMLIAIIAVASQHAWAEQTRIRNYETTRNEYFWAYYADKKGDEVRDIYCGVRFPVEEKNNGKGHKSTDWMSIEHAMPAQAMAISLGCLNRKECPSDPDVGEKFDHAEADMHNMWPALRKLNSSRGKRKLAEIEGDEPFPVEIGQKTFQCDFENNGEYVEPRPQVRGNLARSIFYMCSEYGFAVPKEMMPFLRAWNREDPPTPAERRRAEWIAEQQGTRNKFIDNPALGDTVKCKRGNW